MDVYSSEEIAALLVHSKCHDTVTSFAQFSVKVSLRSLSKFIGCLVSTYLTQRNQEVLALFWAVNWDRGVRRSCLRELPFGISPLDYCHSVLLM